VAPFGTYLWNDPRIYSTAEHSIVFRGNVGDVASLTVHTYFDNNWLNDPTRCALYDTTVHCTVCHNSHAHNACLPHQMTSACASCVSGGRGGR